MKNSGRLRCLWRFFLPCQYSSLMDVLYFPQCPATSGNLFKNMPDQPFLCLVDMFEQRGLVHAHLLRQFTGVYLPGMFEKSPIGTIPAGSLFVLE